jgi:phosphatidylserine/phosphatidylglycerophosphate/cardiolipin synthase-like enzyme
VTGNSLLRSLQAVGVGQPVDIAKVRLEARRLAEEAQAAGAGEPGKLEEVLAAWIDTVVRQLHEVSVVATGDGWGPSVRSVDQAMLELVLRTERCLHLTVYSITAGAAALLSAIATRMRDTALLNCWCLVDAPQGNPISSALMALQLQFPLRFQLIAVSAPHGSLHAKVLVADRAHAVIGSANLTHSGFHDSHELGVRVSGPVAWEIAQRIETLSCAEFSTHIHVAGGWHG